MFAQQLAETRLSCLHTLKESERYHVKVAFSKPNPIFGKPQIRQTMWDTVKISVDYFSKGGSNRVEKMHQTM